VRYLILVAVVAGINVLPAFGPPTWLILVFARINWHLNPVVLVILGALAAVSGRSALMWASQRFSSQLPARLVGNLDAARQLIEGKKRGLVVLVSAFIISPLPSAQLFIAAGFLHLPRRIVAGAFFAGRLVTYSLYIGVATTVDSRFSHLFKDLLGSPWSIATQLALLLILTLIPLIDWKRFAR